MKKVFAFIFLFFALFSRAQKKQYLSFSLTDNASAYPFGIFVGYATQPVHPGFEFGWGHENVKNKHSWFWELKAGYFYHQFVQHGIPIYGDFGYRFSPLKHFSADISLGLGYFHSIPATEVYKLGANGNYENGKGIGRGQVMLPFTMGINYDFLLHQGQEARVFFQYQQRIQGPFVYDYVPVLPYNQIALGLAWYLPVKK